VKRINIFKAGTHTDSKGTTLDFSEDKLTGAVASYNPSKHEAPIVIGHPQNNNPAFGWIKSLEFDEDTGNVYAEPHQVNADFEEMVTNGSFKKVSASWYLPNHPANPTPGSLQLRHVGFLGAQPPAIKGLEAIEFCEADDQIIEFEDSWEDASNLGSIARVFKGMREFIIDKFSIEEADKVIPVWTTDELTRSSEDKFNRAHEEELNNPNFNEEESMTELEKAKAKIDALESDKQSLQSDNDKLKGQVASFEEANAERAKTAIKNKVQGLVDDGFLLPAQQAEVLAFCESLDATQTVEFGEGDNKKSVKMVDGYLAQFNKKVADFDEHSNGANDPTELSDEEVSRKAVSYQEEQAAKGITIGIQQAVSYVINGGE
jgi:hypothetical protein